MCKIPTCNSFPRSPSPPAALASVGAQLMASTTEVNGNVICVTAFCVSLTFIPCPYPAELTVL